MKLLSIKIPDPLFAEISSEAEARKVSRSVVVRERLESPKQGGASLWSQMEDLVLKSDKLPADLSSNKSHLKGYGGKRAH